MKKILIPTVIALLALAISLFNFNKSNKSNQTGYVLLNDIYEGFEMSKETKKKISAVEIKRNMMLDSLKLEVYKAEKSGSKEFEYAKQYYFFKQQEFEKSNQQIQEQFDEQIWKQINQYVTEYGKENNYQYIFGANGNGSIMYVSQNDNVTEKVLEYINKKYKGVK